MIIKGIKQRSKSWTYRVASLLVILAPVEQNFALLRGTLGDHYGWTFVAFAVIMAALRERTKEAINDK